MKLMIASDLHGSAYWCRKMLECFEKEQAEKLVFLGDILYHGPRNDLPREYAPKQVIAMLNPLADRILAVRGNCEAEVDQMVLQFPVMAEYAAIFEGGRTIWLTHGHTVNKAHPLPFSEGDILLHGHTHVPACENCGAWRYMNPGSLSLPKDGSVNSYMIYEDGVFQWKNLLTAEIYKTEKL